LRWATKVKQLRIIIFDILVFVSLKGRIIVITPLIIIILVVLNFLLLFSIAAAPINISITIGHNLTKGSIYQVVAHSSSFDQEEGNLYPVTLPC